MGLITIAEMFDLLRRYFVRIVALSLVVAVLAFAVVEYVQTYTCTLNYKYNYEEAALGKAPDGISPLDPYQIQDPLVIRGAIKAMGLNTRNTVDVEKVRNNMYITDVIEDLDQEVSDSAALLGEKYTVEPTEFRVSYTYDASWGKDFGTKFFDCLINQYDEYLLTKYYFKKEVVDFAKIIDTENLDYLDIADAIVSDLDSIIENLNGLAEAYPEFRSNRTGYSFADLSVLYQSLRDVQYSKYYANVRAGNLAKDVEVVTKDLQTQIEELSLDMQFENEVAENYYEEITSFYDAYKTAGLYEQAETAQSNVAYSNNRDNEVLEDYDIENHWNTYDSIVLNYSTHAQEASRLSRDIEHYSSIVDSYLNDNVPTSTKERLIEKNEAILGEITTLSTLYSSIANATISEYFATKVNEDLQYLIVTDVQADVPRNLIVAFAFVACFGLSYCVLLLRRITRKHSGSIAENGLKIVQPSENMTELQSLFYQQYKNNFKEMYLAYQPMIDCMSGKTVAYETFIRWNSATKGFVSPLDVINCATELDLLTALNDWIIDRVCQNLARRAEKGEELPVIHVNCPHFALNDLGIAEIIMRKAEEYGVDVRKICMEVDGMDVTTSLDDIMLLQKIGVGICIDRFENSNEKEAVFKAVMPYCVKLSGSILPNDSDATSHTEFSNAMLQLDKLVSTCVSRNIKTCICGVETKEQEKLLLSNMNFSFKQGYLYGKPEKYVD